MEWERYAESAWGVLSEEERRVACLRAISRAWRVLKSTMERCLKAPYLGHSYLHLESQRSSLKHQKLSYLILLLLAGVFHLVKCRLEIWPHCLLMKMVFMHSHRRKTTIQVTTDSRVSWKDIQSYVLNVQRDCLLLDLVPWISQALRNDL